MMLPRPLPNFSNELSPLDTALALLDIGLWPVPIWPPNSSHSDAGKAPIDEAWGKVRQTAETLRLIFARHPHASLGLLLGCDSGISDIEIDDLTTGNDSLLTLMSGEELTTLGWGSQRGPHYIVAYDPRFAKYGKSIIKLKELPGIEIRIGSNPGAPRQLQSVCPPSPKTTKDKQGRVISLGPRIWNGVTTIARLPDLFFANLDRIIAEKQEAERSTSVPVPVSVSRSDVAIRAAAYLETIPDAVSGQHGHDRIYHAACVLVGRFLMTYEEALPVLAAWNQTHAIPPESLKQLEHKLTDACKNAEKTGDLLWASKPSEGELIVKRVKSRSKSRSDSIDVKSNETKDLEQAEGINCKKIDDPVSSPDLSTEWDDPIYPQGITVPEFPFDVFPEKLVRLLGEGAQSVQCPIDYFATAALVLAGGVVGMSVNLRVTSTWIEAPNLYAAVVGGPGTKKTPALKIMAGPLYAIDRELRDRYHEERKAYEAAVDHNDDVKEPVPGQLTIDDTTREAMAQVHAENLRGLIMVMDELTSWVASLNAYKGGKGDDKQFWLKVNSGSLVKVNRKGQRDPIRIGRPCVAVLGGLTPGMLPELADEGHDDGWLDRILFSYPEPWSTRRQWTDLQVSQEALSDWELAIRRLWSRPMVEEENGWYRPYIVHLTGNTTPPTGGKAAWIKWYNAHAIDVEALGYARPTLAGPWSKLEGFCLRIALILSRLDQVYSPQYDMPPWDVDASAIERAGRVVDYFKAHFRRTRGEFVRSTDAQPDEVEAIVGWLVRNDKTEFSEKEVRNNFRNFDKEKIQTALSWMSQHNFIALVPIPPLPHAKRGRKPSAMYEVNPNLDTPSKSLHFLQDIHNTLETKDLGRENHYNIKPTLYNILPDNPETTDVVRQNGEVRKEEKGEPSPAADWLLGYLSGCPAEFSEMLVHATKSGLSEEDLRNAAPFHSISIVVEGDTETWALPKGVTFL